MNWLDALANTGTGGIIGLLGSIGTGFLKIKATREKNRHELAMFKERLKQAAMEQESREFLATHESDQRISDSTSALAAMADGWLAKTILVVLHFYRGSVRPTLAYAAHLIAVWVYLNSDPAHQALILGQVHTLAAIYGGWYFGQRELNKRLFGE